MRRPSADRHAGGFTLVELLVTMVIALILIGALFKFFIAQQRSYSAKDQVVRIQQEARTAEDMIAKAIQQAGAYNPKTGQTISMRGMVVLAASDRYLTIQYDDPYRTADSGVITADEVVTFALSKSSGAATQYVEDQTGSGRVNVYFDQNGDGQVEAAESYNLRIPMNLSGPPYNLYRITPNNANPTGNPKFEGVTANVENLVFRYFDQNGEPLPRVTGTGILVPAPYILSPTDRALVRTMEVNLTLRTPTADTAYTAPLFDVPDNTVATYTAAGTPRTGVQFGGSDDHYRRRVFRTRATPRNLSSNTCGSLTLSADPAQAGCPQSAVVRAALSNRLGAAASGVGVLFTLDSASSASFSSGSVVASTTVNTDASGEATVTVYYTGLTRSIAVSAAAVLNCAPVGPDAFTLINAVPVDFVPGNATRFTVDQYSLTTTTLTTDGDPATVPGENPTPFSFRARAYDACGNEVDPQPGVSFEAVALWGTQPAQDYGLAAASFDATGQIFTVSPQAAAPSNAVNARGAGNNFPLTVRVAGALPPWVTTTNLPPSSLYSISMRPWPPRTLVDDNPGTSVQNDCSSTAAPFPFRALDWAGNEIHETFDGATDPTRPYTVLASLLDSNCAGIGTSRIGALGWQANTYWYNFTPNPCQIDPESTCLNASGALTPTYRLELYRNGLASPIATTAPGTLQVAPCGTNVDIVVTPATMNDCIGTARVSVSLCNLNTTRTLALGVERIAGGGNLSFTQANPGAGTTSLTLAGSGTGPYVGTTSLYLGDAYGQNAQFGLRAYYPNITSSRWVSPRRSATLPVKVTLSNGCREIDAYSSSSYASSALVATDRWPITSTFDPAFLTSTGLYFRVQDCQSYTPISNAVNVCLVAVPAITTTGYPAATACYDEEWIDLEAAAAGYPPLVFQTKTGQPLPVSAYINTSGSGTGPTAGDKRLQYPPGSYAYLLIGYRDPQDPSGDNHTYSPAFAFPGGSWKPPAAYPTNGLPGQTSAPLVPRCNLSVMGTTSLNGGQTIDLTAVNPPLGGTLDWSIGNTSLGSNTSISNGNLTLQLKTPPARNVVTLTGGTQSGGSPVPVSVSDSVYGSFCPVTTTGINVNCSTISISMSTTSVSLGPPSGTLQLTATRAGGGAVSWDPTISTYASVISSGTVTAGSMPGSVAFTARDGYGCTASQTVISTCSPMTVRLGTTSLAPGAWTIATAYPAVGPISWSLLTSTPAGAATITTTGTVTAVAAGTAVIRATDSRTCPSTTNATLAITCGGNLTIGTIPLIYTPFTGTPWSTTVGATGVAPWTWTVYSNPSLATFSPTNIQVTTSSPVTLRALAIGTAGIRATDSQGCFGTSSATLCGAYWTPASSNYIVTRGLNRILTAFNAVPSITTWYPVAIPSTTGAVSISSAAGNRAQVTGVTAGTAGVAVRAANGCLYIGTLLVY